MATACILQVTFGFESKEKPIAATFDMPHASSDGGAVLLSGNTKALIGSGPQWASAPPLFTVSLLRHLRGRRAKFRVEAMGLFRVRGRLTGPTGRSEDAELLVDTGATLLVVPRSLAERLELVARRSQPVQIAGGQRAERPVAEVSLALTGQDASTPCFIAPDGPALLGAVALESLFLAVDPVAKRLIPVEGFVGAAP